MEQNKIGSESAKNGWRLWEYDSAEPISAEKLGISSAEYDALIVESIHFADNPSGVVCVEGGQYEGLQVYAQ